MRFLLTAICAMLSSAVIAEEGPFGFDLNKNPVELPYCEARENTGWYLCDSAPNPHPEMESYNIQYMPKFGVCFIKGIGIDVDDNHYGTSTKARLAKIADQVALNYGTPTDTGDNLIPMAIWDDPDEWLISINKKERFSYVEWELEKLIKGINIVYIAAKSLGYDTGFIVVEFYTPDSDKCNQEIESMEANVF